MKLAVIGGGPTGIISAILASRRPGEIDRSVARDIFESTKAFRGRSFDTDSTNMLLNTSIGLNSLDPGILIDFTDSCLIRKVLWPMW
jgi:uncharacterized NAD(P)/FAD-binding protein YdhS